MTDIQQQWITKISQGGPYQASVVIKANPETASRVSARLQPYRALPDKFTPALESAADYVRNVMIPRTFEKEGPGWRRLSKRTQRERTALGYGARHPILIRSRDLFSELTERSHPKHVEIIKSGVNARIVIGGRSEKFVRNQLGNTQLNIPSRPMIPGTGGLPVPTEDQERLKQIIREKIKEQLHRGLS